MRFHVLAIPHTVTCKRYSACAFTQKVLKFCKMMSSRGHQIVHYGHEDTDLEAIGVATGHVAHVTVMTNDILKACYGDYNWRTQEFKHNIGDSASAAFTANAITAVKQRKQKGDYLLLFWGEGHARIAAAHSDLIVVEPGIGSYNKLTAPFAIFESYAVMHFVYGKYGMSPRPCDAVVPNYFDVEDFQVPELGPNEGPTMKTIRSLEPGYVLFLGRVIKLKGIQTAIEATKFAKMRLVIAGQGTWPHADHLTQIGYVEPSERALLLSKACCLIVPSLYVEPFAGVAVEAQIAGIPVVTTDWGAFAETVVHGKSGFRCRTMEQFVWALQNVGTLDRLGIRERAIANYGFTKVATMYEECFAYMANSRKPIGSRLALKWLDKQT